MTSTSPETLQKKHDGVRACTPDRIIELVTKLQSQLDKLIDDTQKPEETVSRSDNDQPSKGLGEGKRASRWPLVCAKVLSVLRIKNAASNRVSYESSGSQSGKRRMQTRSDAVFMIKKLRSDIGQMKTAFEKLTGFQNDIVGALHLHLHEFKKKLETLDLSKSSQFEYEVKEFNKKIFNMNCRIPLLPNKPSSSGGLSNKDSLDALDNEAIDVSRSDIYLPGVHMDKDFIRSSTFEQVKEKFLGLGFTCQLCLLCFAVLPENREVKKTMLMYWWIGEDFIPKQHAEESITTILGEFSKKGLIEPVKDDRKLKPNSYKMEPQVHCAVIRLAKELGFFEIYNEEGKPSMAKSTKKKVCLVEWSSSQPAAKVSKMEPRDLETVFNVSERFPDFTFKWFPMMQSLKVLYLGRWERTAERHIEVENIDLLENMYAMKKLRLVSFQGISRIEKLDSSICKLPKLVILDLRACYNLEVLPEEIGSLGSLMYLDVSECYMLDRLPKKIAELSKLEVLKGFVATDADEESCCTVSELKSLQNLRKLSMNVNQSSFQMESLIVSLQKLTRLESLKVAWGARFSKDKFTDMTKDKKGKKRNEGVNEAERKRRSAAEAKAEETHEVKKKQGGPSTELKDKSLSKKGNEQGDNKGDTGEEKKRAEEKGNPPVDPEDKIQNKKEDDKGDGKGQPSQDTKGDGGNEEMDLAESKARNGVEEKNQKSDEIVEEDKKLNHTPERKVHDGVEEKTQKLDKIVEEDKKLSHTPESKPTIQETDDGKGDNSQVKSPTTESLDPNLDKNRVSKNKKIHDAASTPKNKERTSKGTESSDAVEPAQPIDQGKRIKNKKPFPWLKKPQAKGAPSSSKLPSSLKKLELECFPGEEAPSWMNPNNLGSLEKLSIKGGKLSRISDEPSGSKNECSVKVLRLKYLDEFKAEWRDLQALFPKMKLFEKYKCPKITFCPTDGLGVYRLHPQQSEETTEQVG